MTLDTIIKDLTRNKFLNDHILDFFFNVFYPTKEYIEFGSLLLIMVEKNEEKNGGAQSLKASDSHFKCFVSDFRFSLSALMKTLICFRDRSETAKNRT